MDNLNTENLKPATDPAQVEEKTIKKAEDTGASSEPDYEWVVRTKCISHDAKDIQEWKQRRQKYQGMGIDDEVEKPPKRAKKYQFHIQEVESLVEYEDEDFGEIVVINKYNGNQVPILEDFSYVADIHLAFNRRKDELVEHSSEHYH